MTTSTATGRSEAFGADRRAFGVAAAVSIASTVILFAFLALAGVVTTVTGPAGATRGSRRAVTLLGVGGGLLVGPVLYLALAVVVNFAG